MPRAKNTTQYLFENYLAGRSIRPIALKGNADLGFEHIPLINKHIDFTHFPVNFHYKVENITVKNIRMNHKYHAKWVFDIEGHGKATKKAMDKVKKIMHELLNNIKNFEYDFININEDHDKDTNYSEIDIFRNKK